MSTFYGTEICAIDAKGRLNVPARMRRGLDPEANDTFIMVRGFDGCVNLYPLDEWRRFTERLRAMSVGDQDARSFVRILLGSAQDAVLDSQGRINLTEAAMATASVEKEARLIGTFDHIEIWNVKKYDTLSKAATPNFEDMARKLFT